MQQLFQHLENFYKLSSEAREALEACFEELVLPKGEIVANQGNVCRHMYFLQKGALRGFYNIDGKEITHWFGFENDFVTSFHSFITGEPAVENLQLLEGSVLYAISKETLTGLFKKHHEIETLVRIVYERYYIRLEERYVNAQFKTASQRYEDLLLRNPHIIERVSLGQISSYLGISQETLSRIRSRL